MNAEEFRVAAKQLIDYIADYIEGLRERSVLPDVEPGYLNALVPERPPERGESWNKLFDDIEPIVMRGMTHWHSPRFHAYFPTANSYPAICGDMLSTALSCIGFTWNAAPACTELEMRMMDWLASALGLPEHFFFQHGPGGGVIQTTASESTLIAMLGARTKILLQQGLDNRFDADDDSNQRHQILSRLVAYTSDQSHSSVEKAAMLSATRIRLMPSSAIDLSLDAEELRKKIVQDRERGLIPLIVIATLGTTNTCAFDDLEKIGTICFEENIWLHVDAAYAGSVFVCPEQRHYLKGIEYATSFTMNPHKWLLVNFDCNAFWLVNLSLSIYVRLQLTLITSNEKIILLFKGSKTKHENQDRTLDYRVIDSNNFYYRSSLLFHQHWQIPLGRRFRSLKLWFVFRNYGIDGLQKHIRKQLELAKLFGQLLKTDDRFELIDEIRMGLVCFRLKGSNDLNERLINSINHGRKIFLTPCKVKEKFIIRFAICARTTNENDIFFSWNLIKEFTDNLIESNNQ
ncbi:Pyridoxal-dependent decarboxylase-like protein [Sarcoptes scabiei]|uniref:Aromatic-L-amino-acid decarboxylase n=1 Tax=Sarcoptes scabiei TaxID=52283 RepID=A0A132A1J0_SARSC|nr:Pyridoxal-dependent decarboxylase-like protein [Sarcoptes scabiei]